jgi:hypothetical protein
MADDVTPASAWRAIFMVEEVENHGATEEGS